MPNNITPAWKDKGRFSDFACDVARHQEYAGGLKQRLNNETKPVMVRREMSMVRPHIRFAACPRYAGA
jgi:hypothetical protein